MLPPPPPLFLRLERFGERLLRSMTEADDEGAKNASRTGGGQRRPSLAEFRGWRRGHGTASETEAQEKVLATLDAPLASSAASSTAGAIAGQAAPRRGPRLRLSRPGAAAVQVRAVKSSAGAGPSSNLLLL